jgi:hypothetical protein
MSKLRTTFALLETYPNGKIIELANMTAPNESDARTILMHFDEFQDVITKAIYEECMTRCEFCGTFYWDNIPNPCDAFCGSMFNPKQLFVSYQIKTTNKKPKRTIAGTIKIANWQATITQTNGFTVKQIAEIWLKHINDFKQWIAYHAGIRPVMLDIHAMNDNEKQMLSLLMQKYQRII